MIATDDLDEMLDPALGPRGDRESLLEVHRIAVEQLEAGELLAHQRELVAQFGAIPHRHDERAIGAGAVGFGKIIGPGHRDQVDPLLAEIVEHLGTGIDKRLEPVATDIVGDHRIEIAQRLLARVSGAGEPVIGDPGDAARGGRGAAIFARLLDDDHIEAEILRAQRRGHARRARAHHNHIMRFERHQPSPQSRRSLAA